MMMMTSISLNHDYAEKQNGTIVRPKNNKIKTVSVRSAIVSIVTVRLALSTSLIRTGN